jgi:mannose-6-phosphate isomerase
MSLPVFKVTPGIQSYAWGKKGSSSLAAQLGERCISDFKVDEEKTYAEVYIAAVRSGKQGYTR